MEDKARRWCFVQLFVALSGVTLCVLLYAPRFTLPANLYGTTTTAEEGGGGGGAALDLDNQVGSACSSLKGRHGICCDRSDANSDICFMAGDVRMDAATRSLLLFPPPAPGGARPADVEEERIQPYTCKWLGAVMKTIHEVKLRVARPEEAAAHRCDVQHDVPVHVVTAGGYNTGNYFHAFNDGFVPTWLTVQHLRRRVVLAVLAYNKDWAGRYSEVIGGLTEHRVVDLMNDNRTHCFPGAIVGTRFHGYLTVDPARLRDNKTILHFQRFLAGVYKPPLSQQGGNETEHHQQQRRRRPRLGIVSRGGIRVIENEAAVARLAERIGFDVRILVADKAKAPPLRALHDTVSGLDALVGVHGSDLTSILFLRPGRAALIQVAPLGVPELSYRLFGAPAERMGLRYEQYDVRGDESSLSREYPPGHVVVADPARARQRPGSDKEEDWDWDFIGRVYLGGQNVTLDLARFGDTLARTHFWLLELQERGRS